MQYAQLNESKTDALQVAHHGNIEWDSAHFCPASALTEEESAIFRVVPLNVTEPPTFDPVTQSVMRDGCDLVEGAWQYKWRIDALSAEQVDANQVAASQALQAAIIAATQARLDTFAKTRNYDGILSACSYATSGKPRFAAEGQYAVDARDQTWSALYALMGEVLAGAAPMPESFGDVEPLLPELAWPV